MSARPRLLRPRWVLTHVLVLAVAAGLVALGVWQWQRRAEVLAADARLSERLAVEPRPLAELPDVGPGGAAPATLEHRRVTVAGTWTTGDRVLQRSRSHQGRNGWHVLTPLRIGGDRGILVRRGWIPFDVGEEGRTAAVAAPPEGRVTVTGWLEVSDEQPGFGPTDPTEGELDTVFHADVDRLARQTDLSLHPMVLHLQSQQPPQPGRLPIPAPRPELDATRHLSYAIQWFSFAVVGLIAYGAFLRRRPRDDGRPDGSGGDAPTAGAADPPSLSRSGREA